MAKPRSLAIAILLALFLGPIGLLYGSLRWAILMAVLVVLVGFIPFVHITSSLFIILWLLCPYLSVWMILRDQK